MKTTIIFILSLWITSLAIGQNQAQYAESVKEAYSLYEAKRYKESAAKYKAAFDQLDGKAYPNDRYNAACSYALTGNAERAFYHLLYLAENPKIKYDNLDHISNDKDLTGLHTDDRWSKVIQLVTANKAYYEKDLDKELAAQLSEIHKLDQHYRGQLQEIIEKYGSFSKEEKEHWKLINKTDAENLVKVKKILDERGWLGSNIIGKKGNKTLFLVIQHADIKTQAQYLPMMREAVKMGNANASDLALLEDRVALGQGKRQIYGSQLRSYGETNEYFVSPMIEPEKVNERRQAVGLGTIEDYLSNWGMTWDVEAHKANTKRIEAESKK